MTKPTEGHQLLGMEKYSRGQGRFGGKRVGYVVSCECGWSTRVNVTKREAGAYHSVHVQGAHAVLQERDVVTGEKN